MQLKNTINEMSCVYEAFIDAGLPVNKHMKENGVMPNKLFELLKKYGYQIYIKKGKKPFRVSINSNESFFVMRVWDDGKHHLEHHDSLDIVTKYDKRSVAMVAKKAG